MCTNLEENGKKKSTYYWEPGIIKINPSEYIFIELVSKHDIDSTFIGDANSNITESKTHGNTDITLTVLKVTWKCGNMIKKTQFINHIYLQNWNDYGVPKSNTSIYRLLELINELEIKYSNDRFNNPIVYHCSAGVGRSGTLLAIRNCYEYIEKNIIPDIPEVVKNIRNSRPLAVQTCNQYKYIYKLLYQK
jgi:protein tyrosine phosphatase